MSLNSRITLTIKGKPNLYYEDVDIPSTLRRRVNIIDGNPSMSIYEHADLVLGFNSTCLVEAHLASCHAASIELYDFESADISNYLLPLPDSISRITTTDQLYQLLVCFIQGTLKPFSVDKNL